METLSLIFKILGFIFFILGFGLHMYYMNSDVLKDRNFETMKEAYIYVTVSLFLYILCNSLSGMLV